MVAVNVYFRLNVIGVIHFLFAFTGILLVAYALLIFYFHRIWDRIPDPDSNPENSLSDLPSGTFPDPDSNPENSLSDLPSGTFPDPVRVSVIIPARNEALRIGACLDALLVQSYPKELTEVIVVNDFSTDDTAILVSGHPLKCKLLNLSDYISGDINSYKKKAIETGNYSFRR